MSTSSGRLDSIRGLRRDISQHLLRGVVALTLAGCLLGAVVALDLPVALLTGLFVPLSLAAESGFRARADDTDVPRTEFRQAGLGVLVGALATAVVVFVAVAV